MNKILSQFNLFNQSFFLLLNSTYTLLVLALLWKFTYFLNFSLFYRISVFFIMIVVLILKRLTFNQKKAPRILVEFFILITYIWDKLICRLLHFKILNFLYYLLVGLRPLIYILLMVYVLKTDSIYLVVGFSLFFLCRRIVLLSINQLDSSVGNSLMGKDLYQIFGKTNGIFYTTSFPSLLLAGEEEKIVIKETVKFVREVFEQYPKLSQRIGWLVVGGGTAAGGYYVGKDYLGFQHKLRIEQQKADDDSVKLREGLADKHWNRLGCSQKDSLYKEECKEMLKVFKEHHKSFSPAPSLELNPYLSSAKLSTINQPGRPGPSCPKEDSLELKLDNYVSILKKFIT